MTAVFAVPAYAIGPPGPPPWSCTAHEACEGNKCVQLANVPGAFLMFGSPDLPTSFVAEGLDGHQSIAMRWPSLMTAKHAIDQGRMPDGVSLILIDSERVADAYGFMVHNLIIRGTGEKMLSTYSLLISCNSYTRR